MQNSSPESLLKCVQLLSETFPFEILNHFGGAYLKSFWLFGTFYLIKLSYSFRIPEKLDIILIYLYIFVSVFVLVSTPLQKGLYLLCLRKSHSAPSSSDSTQKVPRKTVAQEGG